MSANPTSPLIEAEIRQIMREQRINREQAVALFLARRTGGLA